MKTKIQYEDEELLVIYKPAGIAVQAGKVTQMDVYSELRSYVKGGYIGLVHRLDQPVEGLLVVAKTKTAAAQLTKQLEEGVLKKSYVALVCCEDSNEKKTSGILEDYLWKNPGTKMAQVVTKDNQEAQLAILQYQRSCEFESDTPDRTPLALMDIEIQTGRFHQIRAQMSHAKYPLLGDQKYGSVKAKEISRLLGVRQVALCANRLSFEHPKTKKRMEFEVIPENIAFTYIPS